MDSIGSDAHPPRPVLEIRLFGQPAVLRDGTPVALAPSRKVRALLGFLAVAPRPVPRERLCDLFWDVPNDPRGELRWCLSKLRAALDDDGHRRIHATGDAVSLDLDGCAVDALDLDAAIRDGLGGVGLDALRALADRCGDDFLQGVSIDRGAGFGQWLAGQRSAYRSHLLDVVAEIGRRTPAGGPDGLAAARRWLDLAPLDPRAHERFLAELSGRGMVEDGQRHLEAGSSLFAAEGADFGPVRQAWADLRRMAPAPVTVAARPEAPLPSAPAPSRRASIAVMPFRERRSGLVVRSGLGDGLTHDVISRLARLRGLFVIARGSVFALADDVLEPQEIGRRLAVEYVATGTLVVDGTRVTASAEVVEAATARILWTETFMGDAVDRFAVLDGIGDGIVSSIASEIEAAERNRAILKAPDSLDAWEAYHAGLWHMYRFTREENAEAAALFRRSAQLDPTFSRAYAGLSFTHWQNAFQGWGDRSGESRLAVETAGRSLLVDDHNPAAHWAMGRALWMTGVHDEAIRELERSVALSPNFALGHYALSFVHSQSGDPAAAIEASDQSRSLSPFDPLLFGMLGARAMAHVRLGAFEEAADWALKAAARPNAHVLILAIAAHCLALAGRVDEARAFATRIEAASPGFGEADFQIAFRFAPDAVALFREAASRIGLRP
jgi:TolB-like protein/DNA-binding SARP family transcriptional activator/tetratricopeptide (TPR) repeat protein